MTLIKSTEKLQIITVWNVLRQTCLGAIHTRQGPMGRVSKDCSLEQSPRLYLLDIYRRSDTFQKNDDDELNDDDENTKGSQTNKKHYIALAITQKTKNNDRPDH